MKELVELIAKALVDQPDRVQVSQLEGEQTTILELKVAPEDLGKVIGGRKDRYGRLREARIPNPDTSPFLTGTGTWIGDTNDWTEDFCTSPKSEVCDLGGALQRSVTDLNKDLQLYLLIEGRFPW